MKFRTFVAPAFVLMLAFTMTFAATTPAYADCSENGYYHSQGKCNNSYKDRGRDDDREYAYQYTNRFYGLQDQNLLSLISYLQELIRQLESQVGENSNVQVTTRSAVDVDEDTATLRGHVYLGNADEAEVYFKYGTSRTDLDEETDHQTIDENDSTYFEEDIDDLDDNTLYYFRAVAEDEDGDEDYGVIYSFRTDDSNSNLDEPTLNTHNAEDVTDDSAELHGVVDMNDFNNGRVFFVYGEDENAIEDVVDDFNSYSAIDEDGDNLQKVLVDSDLDTSATYQKDVTGLDDNTDIYYSICVEYDDADDDAVLACGDIEMFTTD
ncbi:hypothetical protein H6786_01215 [Candidatus Nomurabacteria bacterium]|nr:hypothetical protein [Candidatus Nomurabacteria bacterium]